MSLNPEQVSKINSLMSARKYKELSEYLNSLVESIKSPEVYNLRGIALMNMAEHKSAEHDFKKAISLSDEAVYRANLADSYVQQSRFPEAEKELAKALKLDPKFHHVYTVFSKLHVANNDLEKAITVLGDGLVHNPDQVELMRKRDQLSQLLIAKKRSDGIELMLIDTAQAEMASKKFSIAIELCQSSIRIRETAIAHNTLGICFTHKNRFKEALREFKRSYELDPKFYDALRNIASCYLDMGNPKKAFEAYNELLKVDRKPRWFMERAMANQRLNNLKSALADVEQALKLESRANYLVKKAELLARLRKPEDALAILKGAIELDPLDHDAIRLLNDIEGSYKSREMFR